jgi:hypothetical protein
MDLEHFRAEAERLARPATLLTRAGTREPVAYWHGIRNDGCCISLRDNGRWLNVCLNRGGDHVEAAERPLPSSVPLYAQPHRSLPPVDAVFRFGSEAIVSYLRDNRWQPDWPFNDNFPDDTPARYERVWQSNCPLYSDAVAAVCGGWHFPWPDGDFEELVQSRLVVWTFLESEPWIEVFARDSDFVVMQRIT